VSTALQPAASVENAWAGQGAVLLDIGGDVGALVVTMPSSTVGQEVEVRPLDQHQGRTHTHGHAHRHLRHVAVVSRPAGDGHVPSLVFADLVEGRYELFEKGRPDAVRLRVHVVGGHVTSAAWPD
jgi:hypothetical protein